MFFKQNSLGICYYFAIKREMRISKSECFQGFAAPHVHFFSFPLGGEKLHPVVPTFISCYILYIFHPVFSDFLCGKWILSSYQHHAFEVRLLAGLSFNL